MSEQAQDASTEVTEVAETITTPAENASRVAHKVTGVAKEAALKLKAETNPKRPGSASYDRFEGYFKPGVDTVQKALDAGLTMGDIKYDIIHRFIEVEGAEVTEYTVQSRGPRAKKEVNAEGEEIAAQEVPEDSLIVEDSDNIFG